ncbi:MAG: hypothetical protein DMG38_06010 [Acidobacteria bacterium]|nr:MAG: hypothetical protein DMG38_06010 [Acidobacteriota bacterium]
MVTAVLLAVPSLRGHHGLAQFDTKHPVRLQGTVTDFRLVNPHAYIYADVKDEQGKVRNWKLELGSLGMLTRFGGWTRDTVRRGDQITVEGFPAKDGSAYASLATVQLSNGKVLSAAP